MSAERACPACLRRTYLLRELTPALDRRRPGHAPPAVLSLEPEAFSHAVQGPGASPPRTLARSDDDLLSEAAQDERGLGVVAICGHDDAYPARLRVLGADPPAVLHVLGGVERLRAVLGPEGDSLTVSIVGSRRAAEESLVVARRFGEGLAGSGLVVVSGMAFGVDAAAHEGALAALETGPRRPGTPVGRTIAVLAGGPERATPATLRHVYARIARDGLVVSELPPGSTPRRWSFPARNRLIAALGDALVVVAAAKGSGSLTSASHARDIGRRVGVVPGPVLDPRYAGSNALYQGTEEAEAATPVVDAEDVRLLVLGDREDEQQLSLPVVVGDPLVGLRGDARRVAARLLDGARTLERLVAEEDAETVLGALGALEAAGRLQRSLSGDLTLLPEGRRC